MESLLNHLAYAEGDVIHRNHGEMDITSPYGIYKAEHPYAEIFKYISEVANGLGIYSESSYWDKDIIAVVSDNLDKAKVETLVISFYEDFFEDIEISMYPKEAQVAMFSMYTNSPKRAIQSTQSAINTFHKNEFIHYMIQKEDGFAGGKTFKGLQLVKELCNENTLYGYLFESYMLVEMSRLYGKLAADKPESYLRFLNGWNNRLRALKESR